ncbi:MAG: energy transducer TonB [Bacteroidetes bacterium]|nr:energy transducer TonB [Bacteroidota bacterium]
MKKPELSDEQIRSHMQFEKLLETYKATGPINSSRKWFYIAGYVASGVLIISTALYFLIPRSDHSINETPSQSIEISVPDSSAKSKKQEVIRAMPKSKRQEKKVAHQSKTALKAKDQNNSLPIQKDKKITPSQFTEAEPIHGYPALYEYFDHELKYPVGVRDSIEGVVTVSFAINKEGKPDHIKIENSLGAAFDEECLRIIKSMPGWKPATINGEPIATRLSIALTFKIKR